MSVKIISFYGFEAFLKLILFILFLFFKGNEADPRMRAAAKRRGIAITSISRPIRPSDFKDFDLILAMDEQNKGGFFCNNPLSNSWRCVFLAFLSYWFFSCFVLLFIHQLYYFFG